MVAILFGHYNVVKRLVESGARCNVADELFQDWPLHLAAEKGRSDVVHLIIEAGRFGLNARNRAGLSPIDVALYEDHVDVVKALVISGAYVLQQNFGFTEMPRVRIICTDETGKKLFDQIRAFFVLFLNDNQFQAI